MADVKHYYATNNVLRHNPISFPDPSLFDDDKRTNLYIHVVLQEETITTKSPPQEVHNIPKPPYTCNVIY